MNPLLRFNASKREAMDDLAKVTPDKFQTNDNAIGIQDQQQKITSSENCSVTKNNNYFVQKFLTKNGIGNAPNNDKSPNNQTVISINNPSPMFHPQGYDMQQLQTPIQGNPSIFLNLCTSTDFMDTLAKNSLQHMQNK